MASLASPASQRRKGVVETPSNCRSVILCDGWDAAIRGQGHVRGWRILLSAVLGKRRKIWRKERQALGAPPTPVYTPSFDSDNLERGVKLEEAGHGLVFYAYGRGRQSLLRYIYEASQYMLEFQRLDLIESKNILEIPLKIWSNRLAHHKCTSVPVRHALHADQSSER